MHAAAKQREDEAVEQAKEAHRINRNVLKTKAERVAYVRALPTPAHRPSLTLSRCAQIKEHAAALLRSVRFETRSVDGLAVEVELRNHPALVLLLFATVRVRDEAGPRIADRAHVRQRVHEVGVHVRLATQEPRGVPNSYFLVPLQPPKTSSSIPLRP